MLLKFIKISNIYFLLDIFILFSFLEKYTSIENLGYQQSITLLNGNILIIHQGGITRYDSSLSYKTTIEEFNIDINYDDIKTIKITISRFSEKDYGYIISVIDNTVYILDWEGNILNKNNTNNLNGSSYTIVPIKRVGKKFVYMIGFIENTYYNMTLNFFEYDSHNNITNFLSKEEFILEGKNNLLLNCHLMLNNTENDEIIICFTDISGKVTINASYFSPISYQRINTTEKASFKLSSTNQVQVSSLKTAISLNKQKCLVFFSFDNKAYYSIFFVHSNSFSEKKEYIAKNNNVKENTLNIFYLRETNKFFLTFIDDGNKLNLFLMDENFNNISNYIFPSDNNNNINNIRGFSIIYSYNLTNYYLIIGTSDNSINEYYFNFTSTTINYTNKMLNDITLYIEENENIFSSFTTHIISTTELIPLTTELIPLTTELIPLTTELIPSTTELIPLSTELIPLSTELIPLTTELVPSTTELIPLSTELIPLSTELIPSTTELIPSTTIIISQTIIYNDELSEIIISSTEIDNGLTNYPEILTNPISPEILEIKTNVTRETLIDKLQSIINEIEIGKSYQKIDDDFSIFIFPTNSTNLISNTHVNFTQCEKVLREHYKISDSILMTFLQIELNIDDSKSLINQVEYQALDGNKTILNLSLCENSNINVLYSIKNNTLADLSSASKFQEKGIDIFNLNDFLTIFVNHILNQIMTLF